jgi:transposase
MPTLHDKSLRAALEAAKQQVEALRSSGKLSPEADAVFQLLLPLLTLLLTVLPEKTTRKTSRNSSIPPSQMDADETARRAQRGRKANPAKDCGGPTLQKVTTEETLTAAVCDRCGADLSDVAPLERERRVLYDIVFQVVEQRVTAEVKQCPHCQARCQPAFPASMPGPRQYGSGLQAFISHLLVAQMLSLRRVVQLVRAISGVRLSEATCLGYIRRLQAALQAWEKAACARLLAAPALQADETGLRVDGKNHGLHILTAGSLTLQFLQPKRGKAAIEAIGLIPSYRGPLVHDCWASCLSYEHCQHQLCGAHFIRELTFIVESNNYRWARLLKALLQPACHRVNASPSKALSAAACQALRKRYRTSLTQGRKELPALPPRRKGQRGRIAKSDAHNLHERLAQHEASVLRFLHAPEVSFTNNAGERGLRMSTVKMKVSGCLRTLAYGEAYARISGYLQSMQALGYNPLVAIQIALAGNAVATLEQDYGPTPTHASTPTEV